ncbi:MAG: hypothetical protein AB1405_02380 [Bdellovibrionota bacterium]
MKTAISIPDKLFKEAEKAAKKQGLSRSKFYAQAVERHVRALRAQNVTEKINQLYDEDPSLFELDPAAETAAAFLLRKPEGKP